VKVPPDFARIVTQVKRVWLLEHSGINNFQQSLDEMNFGGQPRGINERDGWTLSLRHIQGIRQVVIIYSAKY
jgi:hypothetical protein